MLRYAGTIKAGLVIPARFSFALLSGYNRKKACHTTLPIYSHPSFKQNAARINFDSYHVALYEDGAKTAFLLGPFQSHPAL